MYLQKKKKKSINKRIVCRKNRFVNKVQRRAKADVSTIMESVLSANGFHILISLGGCLVYRLRIFHLRNKRFRDGFVLVLLIACVFCERLHITVTF